MKKNRLAIFIDGNNFRHGLKSLIHTEDIHWKSFLKEICRDQELVYANYYIGKITTAHFEKEKVEKQIKLFKSLKKAGINIWQGYFNEQKLEKGVDVQIALDLVVGAMNKHFDTALLISGDGDLGNAVAIARHFGARVILGYVAGTKGNNYRISWRLKGKTDTQAALNKQIEKASEQWKKHHPDHEKESRKISEKRTTLKKKSSKPLKQEIKKKESVKKNTDKVPALLLFTDGGSRGNPGPGGCGAVITDDKGKIIEKIKKFIGHCTNNEAEYRALIMGLQHIKESLKSKKPDKLTCYLDSKLVIEQVNGKWKIKKKELRPLHKEVVKLSKSFPNIRFLHIPRSKNTIADKLANEAMDRGE